MSRESARIVLESHGVTLELSLDKSLVPEVLPCLPPGWRPGDPAAVDARFALEPGGRLSVDGDAVPERPGDPTALGSLESALRAAVALHARDHVFIHAGVVARGRRAIVLPGASWSGKSTLVAALVRAGATYFSDEYAVLDADGRVHPFAKPLSLRQPGSIKQEEVPAEDLGVVAGTETADVAVIAATSYAAGEAWDPHQGTAGAGALALLMHAVAARARSGAALRAVRKAADGAVYLEGPRGEAEVTARALLGLIDGPDAGGPTARGSTTQAEPLA